jgi:alkylation response protein AidB-like acyl-CoA dehydrogenase
MWDPDRPGRRNGLTIDRLKWKMGTSELPTAEITLDGAKAYQVGPLERGLANVVGVVLTFSRLTVGLSGAAAMVRAAREARKYAEFRTAFGQRLADFPLTAVQLDRIDRYARRTTAGAFKLYSRVLALPGGLTAGRDADPDETTRRRRFLVRELIMLQKITTAWDGPEVLREAMSIFGGHGVMEDFSALPRFYRDAAVNELWEGPRNVLLTQLHRDLGRAADWYPPSELVADALAGADPERVADMAREADELVAHGNLFQMDEKTLEICARWDDFCHRLYHAYQDLAVVEVEADQ